MSNDVTIRLRLDGSGVVASEIQQVETALSGMGNAAQRASAQTKQSAGAMSGLKEAASGLGFALGAAGIVGGAVAAAAAFVRMADTMTGLDSKLRLVEKSSLAVAAAQTAIEQMALQTHQSIKDVGDTYYRMAKGAETLGLSQKNVADLTLTVSQAIALSGTSAESANAALMQFGQALASGTLRGEELNSVMEQAPALAEAIAKGMHVTTGELRQLGQDGKISVEQIVAALQTMGPEVARQFATLTPTVGMAMTDIGNAFMIVVDSINDATGATGTWATLLSGAANWLATEGADRVGRFFATMKTRFVELYADTEYFFASMKNLAEVIWTTLSVTIENLFNGIMSTLGRVAAQAAELMRKIPLDAAQKGAASLDTWAKATAVASDKQRNLGAELKGLEEKLKAEGRAIFENSDALKAEILAKQASSEAARKLALDTAAGTPKIKADTAARDAAAKALEKERKANDDYVQSLRENNTALAMQGVERERFLAQLKLGPHATEAERLAVDALTVSTYNLSEAEKQAKKDSEELVHQQEKAAEDAKRAAEKAAEDAARPWEDAMKEAVSRIDSAFVDMWKNIGGGFDDFAGGLKDAFKQLLAELAHLAITRPILVQFASAMGLSGGSSSAFAAVGTSSSGGGGLGTIAQWGNAIRNAWSGYQTGGFSGAINGLFGGASAGGGLTGMLGGAVGGAYGSLGNVLGSIGLDNWAQAANMRALAWNGPPSLQMSGGQMVGNIGVNMLAGYAGTKLAGSLMDSREQATGGALGMVGGFVGSIWGPLGTAVGSFIGEALDRALGGSDFTGKRVKLGVQTGGAAGGEENYRTLSSGLKIGNITRRADDAGMSQQQIDDYLNTFDTLDKALTDITTALGVKVDLSNTTLQGPRSPYDGGLTPEGFFGSMAKGELRDSLQTAPDEFVRAWIAEVKDQLPERVRAVLVNTDKQTAADIVGLLGAAADLDKLLNVNVLQAVQKQTADASRTVLQLYDASVSKTVDLAHAYDGSAESITKITAALATQKELAAQIALAYQQLSDAAHAAFRSTIQQIYQDLMTPQQRYQQDRTMIATYSAQLAKTTDPEKIAVLVERINALAGDAWGLLTDDQKNTMGAEFIDTLKKIDTLTQAQIELGQAELDARETATKNAIDLELLNTAAKAQQTAATTLTGAARDLSDAADALRDYLRGGGAGRAGGGSRMAARGAEVNA